MGERPTYILNVESKIYNYIASIFLFKYNKYIHLEKNEENKKF